MLLVGAVLLAYYVVPSPWGAVLVGAAAVVEIAEIFFWVWLSRRGKVRTGAETIIGELATVTTPCRPEGQVRVQGEIWAARCEAGADVGNTVRVVGRRDLLLFVEPS